MLKMYLLLFSICMIITVATAQASEYIHVTDNLLVNPGAEDGMSNWTLWGDFPIISSDNSVGAYGPSEGSYQFYSTGHTSTGIGAAFWQNINFSESYIWTPDTYITYGGIFTGWTNDSPGYKAGVLMYTTIFDINGTIIVQHSDPPVYDWPMTEQNPHVSVSYTMALPENAYIIRYQVNFWDASLLDVAFGADDTFLTLHQVYGVTDTPAIPEPTTSLLLLSGAITFFMKRLRTHNYYC